MCLDTFNSVTGEEFLAVIFSEKGDASVQTLSYLLTFEVGDVKSLEIRLELLVKAST